MNEERITPNEYWENNDCNRDQKFYTAFCILVSACSDYAIGTTLQHGNKLNWACTALYYSLVHAARLIIFVETGDFPTSHSSLSTLFSKGELVCNQQYTWGKSTLRPFAREQGFQVEAVEHFNLISIPEEIRKNMGDNLKSARKLRNDANYEGLLISHEYDHVKVTKSFNRLAVTLQLASRMFLPIMIRQFKDYLNRSQRREYWYAFLNWENTGVWSSTADVAQVSEGLHYLMASLKQRQVCPESISELQDWLGTLRRDSNTNTELARQVLDNIVMSAFGMKNKLMNEFESKIDEFELQVNVMKDRLP